LEVVVVLVVFVAVTQSSWQAWIFEFFLIVM